jgi:Tol biopolymer transport system component
MRGGLLRVAPRALRRRLQPWQSTALHSVHLWFPDDVVRRISPRDGSYYQACIAADGSSVAYWGGRSGAPRIFVTIASDTDAVGPAYARHPSYGGPDNRSIVFAAQPADDPVKEPIEVAHRLQGHGVPQLDITLALFVMSVDGSGLRQLTDGAHVDQRPALSPDGRRVAFSSTRPEGRGLWVMNTDGTGMRSLHIRGAYRPWWSLDGRSVYFFTVYARHQVFVVDVDTEGARPEPLSNDTDGNTHGPALDPRGHRLIVHSATTGQWTLHELPLDGSPMRALPPPGFDELTVSHGTCSRDGVIAFSAHPVGGGSAA